MATQALGLSLPINLGKAGYFATNLASIDQVSDNIRNLLLTQPGERRFNNEFGSSLYKLLFQQLDFDMSRDIIADCVQRDVDRFLTGVLIQDVKVQLATNQPENTDKNAIFISVVFLYNRTVATTNVNITTNRI